jgi:hypothetical protein
MQIPPVFGWQSIWLRQSVTCGGGAAYPAQNPAAPPVPPDPADEPPLPTVETLPALPPCPVPPELALLAHAAELAQPSMIQDKVLSARTRKEYPIGANFATWDSWRPLTRAEAL